MKYIILTFYCIFIFNNYTIAQNEETIVIKAGTNIFNYFPFNERYKYPEFIPGKVVFNNGLIASASLNYSILLNEMQFIAPPADTFSIADGENIRYVFIESDTFLFDNGYLELFYQEGFIRVAQKQYVKFIGIEKQDAYGMTSSTAAIETYRSLQSDGISYNLTVGEDVKLRKINQYYISIENSKFYPVTKRNLKKLFPQNKNEIKTFLKQNSVNLENRQDLLKLTAFLQNLKLE